jgi:hypothetical protein
MLFFKIKCQKNSKHFVLNANKMVCLLLKSDKLVHFNIILTIYIEKLYEKQKNRLTFVIVLSFNQPLF